MVSDVQRKNYKLNDRQVAILKEAELPTEWDELNTYGQDYIKSIEDMLEYVEKKYDKEFCYAGYKAADWMDHEKEELLAYAKGDDRETDCFAVWPTKFGYDDDYPTVYLWPEYVEKYSKQIREIVGDTKFVCFPTIEDYDGKKAKYTSVTIVLSYSSDYKKVVEQIHKKLLNNEELGDIDIYIAYKQDVAEMNLTNYEDIIAENGIDVFFSDDNPGGRDDYWASEEE